MNWATKENLKEFFMNYGWAFICMAFLVMVFILASQGNFCDYGVEGCSCEEETFDVYKAYFNISEAAVVQACNGEWRAQGREKCVYDEDEQTLVFHANVSDRDLYYTSPFHLEKQGVTCSEWRYEWFG